MQQITGIQLSLSGRTSRELLCQMTGWIFAAVLHAFTGTEIPMPDSGIWAHAGMVRGDGLIPLGGSWTPSIGGEPALSQRRRRVFVVADFAGERAAEVLFKPRSMLPYPAPCGESRLPAARGDRIPAAQAGRQVPSCVPSSSGGCGQWQSRAIKKVSARVSAETANPSQLCLPV